MHQQPRSVCSGAPPRDHAGRGLGPILSSEPPPDSHGQYVQYDCPCCLLDPPTNMAKEISSAPRAPPRRQTQRLLRGQLLARAAPMARLLTAVLLHSLALAQDQQPDSAAPAAAAAATGGDAAVDAPAAAAVADAAAATAAAAAAATPKLPDGWAQGDLDGTLFYYPIETPEKVQWEHPSPVRKQPS